MNNQIKYKLTYIVNDIILHLLNINAMLMQQIYNLFTTQATKFIFYVKR